MPLRVYIDHNVWDFLFIRAMDLSIELPKNEFNICLTPEGLMEIPPIPNEKNDLKDFIYQTIEKCSIQAKPYFGFYDESVPKDEQRFSGFGVGGSEWITDKERNFIKSQEKPISQRSKRKPELALYKNEADIAIAARSFHSIVLTLDKKGPLKRLPHDECNVVYLSGFDQSELSLKSYVLKFLETNLNLRNEMR